MLQTQSIAVNVNLAPEDLGKFHLNFFKKRILYRIIYLIGILDFLFGLYMLITSPFSSLIAFVLIISLYILCLPIIFYFRGKKQYRTNLRLQENITYTIDRESIHAKGESFESTFTADKLYAITEVKEYFYMWQSKQIANILPKRCMSESDIAFMKTLLK